MPSIVKIYAINCYQAPRMDETGKRYSLEPWGNDTDVYKGEDDGGNPYILPDGYEVAASEDGPLCIYDRDEHYHRMYGADAPTVDDGMFGVKLQPAWTVSDAAEAWGVSDIRVREYCQGGRVNGAFKVIQGANVVWYFPQQSTPDKRPAGRPPKITC